MKKIPMLEKFAAQSLVEHDGELIFSKERFAELIVRECVNLCYDRAYRGTFGSVTDGAMLCANDIKEQFGVEE